MEEKKVTKISLSTVFLILAIIVIVIMGYFIYNLSVKNKSSEEEVNNLNSKISNLESSVKNYQEKIDSISNTLSSNNTETNNTSNNSNTNTSTTDSSTAKTSNTKYSEITKKLENDDLLQVSDVVKNNDGTYTLKGQIITIDKSKEQITEFPFYKETGEYKQITVASNTKCIYNSYDENTGEETATDTVANVFSKKLYSNAGMGACFNFTFENGKCISVYEVATGH